MIIDGVKITERGWAEHADHTASTTIHEICKCQKFDWCAESERWRQ